MATCTSGMNKPQCPLCLKSNDINQLVFKNLEYIDCGYLAEAHCLYCGEKLNITCRISYSALTMKERNTNSGGALGGKIIPRMEN